MTLERGLPWKQDDPTCKNNFDLFLIAAVRVSKSADQNCTGTKSFDFYP